MVNERGGKQLCGDGGQRGERVGRGAPYLIKRDTDSAMSVNCHVMPSSGIA